MADTTYGKCDGCERTYDRNAPECPYCGTIERVLCKWVRRSGWSGCEDLATGTAADEMQGVYDACDDHRDQPYTAKGNATPDAIDVEHVASLALDALCREVQDELGQTSGDWAAQYFSGSNEVEMLTLLRRFVTWHAGVLEVPIEAKS
jgi:hypothetical protein